MYDAIWTKPFFILAHRVDLMREEQFKRKVKRLRMGANYFDDENEVTK